MTTTQYIQKFANAPHWMLGIIHRRATMVRVRTATQKGAEQ